MLAQAAVFKLIVAIFLAGATTPADNVFYNKATWPTQEACEQFMKSPEGVASLAQLADVIHAQLAPDATIKPYCSDKDPTPE